MFCSVSKEKQLNISSLPAISFSFLPFFHPSLPVSFRQNNLRDFKGVFKQSRDEASLSVIVVILLKKSKT